MLDDSYPSDASECSDNSEWNYILDFFEVISYQAQSAQPTFVYKSKAC